MIRRILCIRRKQELSREEFDQHWSEVHAALVQRHAKLLGTLRYRQLRPNPTEQFGRALETEPFDGIAELWIDPEVRAAASETPEGKRAMEELQQDGQQFIDHSRSVYMVVEETFVFEESPSA